MSFKKEQKGLNTNNDKIIEFTLIYNRYKKRLYNYLLKLSGDEMITEDIIQNVFLKLYDNYSMKSKNPESINYWLFKSARNEYYNYYNKNKRKTTIDTLLENDKTEKYEIENALELKELKKLIMRELDNMDFEQREIYLLKEYGGLNYKEISETMDIEVGLVKSRLYKVRQKLIDKISKIIKQ